MALFSKLAGAARTFGQKLFGGKSEEANKLRREAEAAKERERQARRIADEAARKARELSSPRLRAGSANRAAEQEAERRRQKAMEMARQERVAREQAAEERRLAEELRARADRVERESARQEQQRNAAREAYLRTRQNTLAEDWDVAFQGPRPVSPRIDKSRKQLGSGSLPEEKQFLLLGEPLSRFASSNVDTIVYDYSKKALHIKYIKSQKWYRYSVDVSVAKAAYQAASKGVFTWDSLRVRGTRKGNRVPTKKDSPPPDYLPLRGSAAEYALAGGF